MCAILCPVAGLLFPQGRTHAFKISLCNRLIIWRLFLRPFEQRVAEGGDGVFKACGAALALPESPKLVAEVILRRRPVRGARARVSFPASLCARR